MRIGHASWVLCIALPACTWISKPDPRPQDLASMATGPTGTDTGFTIPRETGLTFPTDTNPFDFDGDGFMMPSAKNDYAQYVAEQFNGQPPFEIPPERAFEDCLDEADATITVNGKVVDPATVFPRVDGYSNPTEIPYDGVDSDCDQGNDFDADGDGYMPKGVQADYETYIERWGLQDAVADWVANSPDDSLKEPVEGDCDDEDADTWPGALEVVTDGQDQDCDGGVDTSAFGVGTFSWQRPTNPEVGRIGDHYVIFASALRARLPTDTFEVSALIPFPTTSRGAAEPLAGPYLDWDGKGSAHTGFIDATLDPNPLDTDFDLVPDPAMVVASTWDNNPNGHLRVSTVVQSSVTGLLARPLAVDHASANTDTSNTVDVVLDGDGNAFAIKCAPTGVLALHVDRASGTTDATATEGTVASTCYFTQAPYFITPDWWAQFDLCFNNTCRDRQLRTGATQLTLAAKAPRTFHVWGDYDEGVLLRIDAAGGGWIGDGSVAILPNLTDHRIVHADAAPYNGATYVVAIAEDAVGGREVWLQHDAVGGLTTQNLGFVSPLADAAPEYVSIHVDDERLMVAVVAWDPVSAIGNDVLAWVFLAP